MSYASERWEILRAIGYPKIPMCVRCGVTLRAILTADHRAGDGYTIRKRNRKTGWETGWVRHEAALAAARNGTAREKYQVLCQNDNILKKKQNGENIPGCHRAAQIEAENRQWGLFDEISTTGRIPHQSEARKGEPRAWPATLRSGREGGAWPKGDGKSLQLSLGSWRQAPGGGTRTQEAQPVRWQNQQDPKPR